MQKKYFLNGHLFKKCTDYWREICFLLIHSIINIIDFDLNCVIHILCNKVDHIIYVKINILPNLSQKITRLLINLILWMINNHHKKRNLKKNGEGPKNIVKSWQKWEKLVKNWNYMHFDTKKYITNKNWVFGGIYNTYHIIRNWKKIWKK